jgi:ABC-type transport system involved in multi-copper enzyme maturation permease subunit
MREHQQAILDLLCATPLTSLKILMGKLGAVLMVPAIVLLTGEILCGFTLPLPLAFTDNPWAWPEVPWLPAALFFPFAFSLASLQAATAGLLGAVLSRSGQKAMVLSYLFTISGLFALPLLTGRPGLSPLTALLATGGLFGLRFTPGDIPLSLLSGLSLAALEFGLAHLVFEKTWIRER